MGEIKINTQLIIPKEIYKRMILYGEQVLPVEACGILSGIDNKVRHNWELENEQKSSRRFYVSKERVGEVLEKIIRINEVPLAIYHTHPTTEARPSRQDILFHPDPNVYMIIISYKRQSEMKAFHVKDGEFTEVSLFFL